ncbi:pectate lyase family protein [Georgenia muralis]
MQVRRTTRTLLPLVAATSVIVLGLGAPASAERTDERSNNGTFGVGQPRGDLGRTVLGENDGWAAAEGGTTGGAAATEENVFRVDTWAELQAALGGPGARDNDTAKIIYVEGELNAFERADGTVTTCETFEEATGFSQDDYIAAFDPQTWDYTVTEDEREALQAHQDEAANAQAAQTQQHIGSNTTVVGVGDDARIVGANLRIRDADNVIVRNLTVSDSTDCFPEWDPSDTGAGNWNSRYDNISVWTSTHVWIDHNTLDSGAIPPSQLDTVYGRPYEVHDGLLDITHSSDLITVSYNEFGEHDKTMLIGSSDGRTQDRGTLRVTLHHNNWTDIGQRAPRVRYGQVHVYNNLYTQTTSEGFSYYWGVGRESQIVAENNVVELAEGSEPADIIALWTDLSRGEAMTETGTMIDGRWASALDLYNAAADTEDRIPSPATWDPTLHERIEPTPSVKATVELQAGAGVLR